jgi:hypothetical protein
VADSVSAGNGAPAEFHYNHENSVWKKMLMCNSMFLLDGIVE